MLFPLPIDIIQKYRSHPLRACLCLLIEYKFRRIVYAYEKVIQIFSNYIRILVPCYQDCQMAAGKTYICKRSNCGKVEFKFIP